MSDPDSAEGGPARLQPESRARRDRTLRKRADYVRIQGSGARVSGECLVFIGERRADGGPSARLGITVSRKTGNAVTRNRAKRLIREAFRARSRALPEWLDLVVIVRRPLGDRKLVAVQAEFERAIPSLLRRIAQPRVAKPARP